MFFRAALPRGTARTYSHLVTAISQPTPNALDCRPQINSLIDAQRTSSLCRIISVMSRPPSEDCQGHATQFSCLCLVFVCFFTSSIVCQILTLFSIPLRRRRSNQHETNKRRERIPSGQHARVRMTLDDVHHIIIAIWNELVKQQEEEEGSFQLHVTYVEREPPLGSPCPRRRCSRRRWPERNEPTSPPISQVKTTTCQRRYTQISGQRN